MSCQSIDTSSVSQDAQNSVEDTADWKTFSAGIGNDYLTHSADMKAGRIRMIDNLPSAGISRVKVVYDWGYTSGAPEISEAKEATVLGVVYRLLANPAFAKAALEGYDSQQPLDINKVKVLYNDKIARLRKQGLTVV